MRGNTISIRLGRAFIGQTGNLYQYDRGQRLLIEGVDLPEVYQAHFSNAILGRSKPMVGTPDGVDIPDEYLESGMDVHVWIYVSGEDHAETEYHGIIHVTRRAEPTDIQPTPAQATVIDTLVSELNDALEEAQGLAEQIPQDIDAALEEAKESGEFDGPPGPQGEQGPNGDTGPRGAAGAGMVYVDTYSQSGGLTTMLGIAEWQYAYRLGAIVPVVIRTTVPNAANLRLMVGTDTAKTCKVYPLPGSGASLQPGIYFMYCVGNQYQLRLDGFQGKVNGFTIAEAASKGVNTTMPTTPSDSYVPTTKLMTEQLAEKYTKPATGIPASDLAEGVIPDPTELIDDDAGEGDTNKVWSADKTAEEFSDVNIALNDKPDIKESTETGVDLDVSDENGNVIVRLSNGHIQTKGFDSSQINMSFTGSDATADMDVSDVNGNVILRLTSGQIKTKNFNSGLIRQLTGKKWTVIGDSLTEHNQRATKNYHDYIAEETGITVVNLGRSGRGYAKESNGMSFIGVYVNIPEDTDVITIFGSGNDMSAGLDLGDVTDSTNTTLCGCINLTLDAIYGAFPLVPIGVITPTPWQNNEPSDGDTPMSRYSTKIVEICALRGVPCLDLYHCSNLHPDDADFRSIAYSRDEGNGVHPDENGHKFIAPRFREFLFSLI